MAIRHLLFGLAVTTAEAVQWAVIAAGSKEWMNYRHQANACHAYHVLRSKGIAKDNIIHFNFDDLAENKKNPFPGKVFNRPDPTGPGEDVYAGCHIDYKEGDVTAENFLRVLSGEGEGKVLQSTADDDIFIYFVGHGVAGMSQFPNLIGVGELPGSAVHKVELHDTLRKMHEKRMFRSIVYYLETCHSASMFEDIDVPNVYAVTSANATESGWGTYCHGDGDGTLDMINGQSFHTCLGDLFGVSWMENNEAVDITEQTLKDQYDVILLRNNKSHTLRFGDRSVSTETVADFMGGDVKGLHGVHLKGAHHVPGVDPLSSAVSADDMELKRLQRELSSATSAVRRAALQQELVAEMQMRHAVESVYRRMVEMAFPGDSKKQSDVWNAQAKPNHPICEMHAYHAIVGHCAHQFSTQSSFPLKFHQIVVNLCAASVDVASVASSACDEGVVVV